MVDKTEGIPPSHYIPVYGVTTEKYRKTLEFSRIIILVNFVKIGQFKSCETVITDKIFVDFFTFYHNFLLPQINRNQIITTKKCIYELPHGLPNNVRLRILGN